MFTRFDLFFKRKHKSIIFVIAWISNGSYGIILEFDLVNCNSSLLIHIFR